MINAGMVFSDRHYGGINYPKGGVGQIAQKLAEGLETAEGKIHYQARVTKILTENGKAVGVQLASGQVYRAKRIVSNSTRWDTFEKLLPAAEMPKAEKKWQQRYQKSPSFLNLHLGVKAEVLPDGTECHHILLENWDKMEAAEGWTHIVVAPVLEEDQGRQAEVFEMNRKYVEEFKRLQGLSNDGSSE